MLSKRKQAKQAAEELVQTQVLNIEEVRKVASYEKRISKKPAGICALIGAIMILIGSGYQGYIMYKAGNEFITQDSVVERKVEKHEEKKEIGKEEEPETILGESELVCALTKEDTEKDMKVSTLNAFEFTNGKLHALSKQTTITNITPTGEANIKTQQTAYASLTDVNGQYPGYEITVNQKDTGFYVISKYDLKIVDKTTLPGIFTSNEYLKPDYEINTDYNTIKKDLESQKYYCVTNKLS